MTGAGRSPNFVLSDPISIGSGPDAKILPIGTFVRPIEHCYLPPHILNNKQYAFDLNDPSVIFCYTHFGIIPVPKAKVRKL